MGKRGERTSSDPGDCVLCRRSWTSPNTLEKGPHKNLVGLQRRNPGGLVCFSCYFAVESESGDATTKTAYEDIVRNGDSDVVAKHFEIVVRWEAKYNGNATLDDAMEHIRKRKHSLTIAENKESRFEATLNCGVLWCKDVFARENPEFNGVQAQYVQIMDSSLGSGVAIKKSKVQASLGSDASTGDWLDMSNSFKSSGKRPLAVTKCEPQEGKLLQRKRMRTSTGENANNFRSRLAAIQNGESSIEVKTECAEDSCEAAAVCRQTREVIIEAADLLRWLGSTENFVKCTCTEVRDKLRSLGLRKKTRLQSALQFRQKYRGRPQHDDCRHHRGSASSCCLGQDEEDQPVAHKELYAIMAAIDTAVPHATFELPQVAFEKSIELGTGRACEAI